jgi:hypothetical protein
MEHESDSDSYGGEAEDISDESRSDDTSTPVEITDTDPDNSSGKEAQQWVEMKTYCLPNMTKYLSGA